MYFKVLSTSKFGRQAVIHSHSCGFAFTLRKFTGVDESLLNLRLVEALKKCYILDIPSYHHVILPAVISPNPGLISEAIGMIPMGTGLSCCLVVGSESTGII